MSEVMIPQAELTDWGSNPYERMRKLYPLHASPSYLRSVVANEASPLYKASNVVKDLTLFSQLYGMATVARLDAGGYEFSPTLQTELTFACRAGVLVALDVYAYTLSEQDRDILMSANFDINASAEAELFTIEQWQRAQAATVLEVVDRMEESKVDKIPFELRLVAEAMFRDTHPSVAIEQERAFEIGATMLYEIMEVAVDPNTQYLLSTANQVE